VGRDCLLTADRQFCDALSKVDAYAGVGMAKPVFVNRTAPDIVNEVTSVLGW
jgi:hypothetical protein